MRGNVKTRSHKCKRGTQECVRHVHTENLLCGLLRFTVGLSRREMLIQPMFDIRALTRLHDALPKQIASSLIVFGHNVFPSCKNQYWPTRPRPATIIRRVDDLVILHCLTL